MEHHRLRFRYMNRTKIKILDITIAFAFRDGLPEGWTK